MGIDGNPSATARSNRRAVALTIGVALVVVATCLALMMAQGSGSREVVEHSRSLHWTNTALGSAAVARAGNAQAVVFAVDHAIGVAGDVAFEEAVAEAHRTLDVLAASTELRPATLDGVETDMSRFTSEAARVLDLIESGDVNAAVDLSQGDFETAYTGLYRTLAGEQEDLLDLIDQTEGAVGRTAAVARVLVTLLIPVAALVAYFLIARRQMRERRIEMEAELRATRELAEAKDEFIAGLSHELRTPLTSIYGFSEILLETGLVDPVHALELITVINHQSSDLSRMVEDLLTAARVEADALSIEMTEVDLAAEIETVLEPYRRAGVSIPLSCPHVLVWADALRLRQVIRNLVSNAERHGGPHIRIEARDMADKVILTVIDDGPGVSPDIEDRLFNRFIHNGHEALLAGSVGLGLSIARALTYAMGGAIRYSRIDQHSIFSISLRRAVGYPTSPRGEMDLSWEPLVLEGAEAR